MWENWNQLDQYKFILKSFKQKQIKLIFYIWSEPNYDDNNVVIKIFYEIEIPQTENLNLSSSAHDFPIFKKLLSSPYAAYLQEMIKKVSDFNSPYVRELEKMLKVNYTDHLQVKIYIYSGELIHFWISAWICFPNAKLNIWSFNASENFY